MGCRKLADRGRILLIILAVAAIDGATATRLLAQSNTTPLPPAQKPVNYAEPPREYDTVHTGPWTVMVEHQLSQENPELTKRALARLVDKLRDALKPMPPAARVRLGRLRFYLMYGPKARGGGRDNGLEYYQRNAPSYYKDLDPNWSDCIVIYSAENYVWLSDLWALKALVHELAHAYHLEQWPENQPDIVQAWKNAVSRGLYQSVKDDEGKTIDRAYAMVNQLEYFAELSAMYFARCNYQPFDRAALRNYDPVGYAMIVRMWGVGQ